MFLTFYVANSHSCTVHLDIIKSFISPTNAQLVCFKILKLTLKFTINAPTCFGLTKPKHVGAFIVNFNVHYNILKLFNFALLGRI
jgi:nucleoside phosphorylase